MGTVCRIVQGIAKGQVCQIPSGKPEESNDHSTMAAFDNNYIIFKNVRIFTPKDFKEQNVVKIFSKIFKNVLKYSLFFIWNLQN
jgi:hypothetical protein